MTLNLRQIEVFRAVMVARTVSGAAEMLNASQPGLSRMIKHLESRLGFSLFNRARGRLVPTVEAEVLFSELEQIYRGVEQLDHVVARLRAGDDAIFRIGASPSLARGLAPSLLRQLQDRHPRLIIQFDVLSVDQASEYLVTGRGEYLLTVYPLDHPNLSHKALGMAPMVAVVPEGHPLASRETLSLADLANERLISFGKDSPHGGVITAMCDTAGVQLNVTTLIRFAETACGFVAKGMGLTIVDAITAADAGYAGLVVKSLTDKGTLPVLCHRNALAARSKVSTSFETLIEAIRLH